MEHIIVSNVMSHFTNNDVLSERQHGFRARRSCESLLSLTQELHEHLEKKSQIDLIILDLSKAFDKVPHQRLIGNIWNQGIHGTMHRWINAFLSDLLQRVIVDGESLGLVRRWIWGATGHCARSYLIPLIHQWSAIGSARLSVYYSQSTVLGPILFLSFINDLPLAVPGCLYTTHRALCSVLSYSSHSSMICHWQCQVVCILLTGHCARSYLIPLIHQWSAIGSARLSVYYSQGTVLGPILFLSFINDLPLAVPGCGVRLFADDCVLYRPISSQDDCEALQTDLSNLEAWERKWCMSFNLDKCNIMTVTRKRNKIIHKYKLHEHELERVNSTTYLGVELSGSLTWNRHTCNKATKTLSFLRRNLIL